MLVRDWMTKYPTAVGPDTSIFDAWRLMRERRIRHLPVLRDGRLVGIVSDRDLRLALPSPATALEAHELTYLLDRLPVWRIMQRDVITSTPDTPLDDAARTLLGRRIGALPVVERGVLVGILTRADALAALLAPQHAWAAVQAA